MPWAFIDESRAGEKEMCVCFSGPNAAFIIQRLLTVAAMLYGREDRLSSPSLQLASECEAQGCETESTKIEM